MSWLIPILMTVGGIAVMIWPAQSLQAVYTILGLALVAVGAVVMINPAPFEAILPILIGALFIAIGALNLVRAISLRGLAVGKILLLIAVMALVFGALIVWNPFDSAKVFAVILGLGMTSAGISMLAGGRRYNTDNIKKDVKEQPTSFVEAEYEVKEEAAETVEAEIVEEAEVVDDMADMDLATAVKLARAEEADAEDID